MASKTPVGWAWTHDGRLAPLCPPRACTGVVMRGSDRQSFLHLPRRKIYSIVTSKLGKRRKTVERPRLLPDAESRRAPRRRRRAALRWAGEASRAWMELVILLLHVLALPRGTVSSGGKQPASRKRPAANGWRDPGQHASARLLTHPRGDASKPGRGIATC